MSSSQPLARGRRGHRAAGLAAVLGLHAGCLLAPPAPASDGGAPVTDGRLPDGGGPTSPCGALASPGDELPLAIALPRPEAGAGDRLVRGGACSARATLSVVEPGPSFDPSRPALVIDLPAALGIAADATLRALAEGPEGDVLALLSAADRVWVARLAPGTGLAQVVVTVTRGLATNARPHLTWSPHSGDLAFGAGSDIWRAPLGTAPVELFVPTRFGQELVYALAPKVEADNTTSRWGGFSGTTHVVFDAALSANLGADAYLPPCDATACGRLIRALGPDGRVAGIVAVSASPGGSISAMPRIGPPRSAALTLSAGEIGDLALVESTASAPWLVLANQRGAWVEVWDADVTTASISVSGRRHLDLPALGGQAVLAVGDFGAGEAHAYVLGAAPEGGTWPSACVALATGMTCATR